MVIHSEFLDALKPSSIQNITAEIRDKAKDGVQVTSFAGGLPFIYTTADFQCPTGRSMSIQRRKQLVELAKKYSTFVVEDSPTV